MRYAELTKENKEYLRFMYYLPDEKNGGYSHDQKMEILTEKFDCSERTIRRWWKEELNLTKTFSELPEQLVKAEQFELDEDTDIVLFAQAQSKSPVHKQGFKNMLAYRDFLQKKGYKTQIVVAPTIYRNPTSPAEAERATYWWVDDVLPYLCYRDLDFYDTRLSCTTPIRPTAVNPLSGLKLMAKNRSVVVPHTKIHLEPIPRLRGYKLRTLSTTGAITLSNYSRSKAGQKGHEHHSFGFVVIEKVKGEVETYAPRNVRIALDGSFVDTVYKVEKGKVTRAENNKAMILGDIHAEVLDEDFFQTTLGLLSVVRPKYTFVHDLLDGARFNPHEENDMYIRKKKIREGKYDIKQEIDEALEVLNNITSITDNVKVVESNHDNFLDRHINNGNWKNDLHNSHNYLEYALIQQTQDLTDYGCIFGYLVEKDSDAEYIPYGSSFRVEGIECGLHGDSGTNGSRGSIKQFANLNIKGVIGHGHSPFIYNGMVMVGISAKKDQWYARKGLSSWEHAHAVIHETKKTQLWIFNDNYKFTNLI